MSRGLKVRNFFGNAILDELLERTVGLAESVEGCGGGMLGVPDGIELGVTHGGSHDPRAKGLVSVLDHLPEGGFLFELREGP